MRRLSIPTMFAFGFGQTAEGVKNQAFNVFLLFFYTQVVGIPGTWAGAALAIALMFDAITDPLAGLASDRFRSRWGRRHPFMFVSVFPLAICFVALFSPPAGLSQWANFLWLTFFAILVRGSLTFYYVPHLALGAEIAHDYTQRSTLFAFSTVFSITAMALVSIVGFRYFFPTTELYNPGTLNPDRYLPFAVFFGALMCGSILYCCWGTRKEIPYMELDRTTTPMSLANSLQDLKEVFRNRSFRLILFGMLMTTFAIAVEAVMSPFMGVHFWGLPTERLGLISIGTLVGLWIGLPLAPLITKVLDKRLALVLPAIFVVINANAALVMRLADVPWFPDNESPWIFWIYFTRYLLQGICLPVILASFNSMFADISDEVELQTGVRREGVIYAARSFSNKVTGAMGAFVGGVVLDVIAFPRGASVGEVPANTIWWLGFMEGPATSVLSICGVLFYLRYQIDRKRHAEIMQQIAQRRQADSQSTA